MTAPARRPLRLALLAALALPALAASAPPAAAQTCDATLKGWQLRSCLRAHYKPADLALDYDAARDALFADVERRERTETYVASIDSVWAEADSSWTADTTWAVRTVAYIEGLYGGAEAPPDRPAAQAAGFNTEHVVPQSRGAAEGNARADLHHLFPAHGAINSARSNFPFGEAADAPPGAAPVYLHGTATHAACPDLPARPGGPPAECSVVWRTGTPPLHLDGDGLAAVRPSRRGDVARAAFYAYTVYQVEVEDALPWPAGREWFDEQKETLLAWHEADPPDAFEVARTWRAAAYQGGRPNPYVTDPSLVRRALFKGRDEQKGDRPVWINEVHAQNAGRDTGEGVELAGRAGTDLYAWRLFFYGARGHPYDPRDPHVAERATLDRLVPHEAGSGSNALGAVWQPVRALWNGCAGLALFDPDMELAEFLSYGGCRFNALSGPVYDWAESQTPGGAAPSHPDSLAWSAPVLGPGRRPVQEWTQMPAGYSLQLTGAGSVTTDFAWGGPHPASPGRLNDYQAPASGVNLTTGWAAGSAVPAPLAASASRATATTSIHPDLTGTALLAALDADFSPARTLSYARVRDSLFTVLADLSPSGDSVRTVYADYAVHLPPGADPTQAGCDGDRDGNPRTCNGPRNVQTEHAWPRSRGTDGGDPERDAHHLFPARADVNNARSNHPYGEVATTAAGRWYRHGKTRTAPPPDPEAWARLDGRADLFEPRAAARGDVARALFYVRAVYPERVAAAETWFEAQLPTLLAWHAADPADDTERQRSAAVVRWQRTENPFVLDATLADRAFAPRPTSGAPSPSTVTLTLGPPRPNPSAGRITFDLVLPTPGHVRAVVLDALGREVAVLHSGEVGRSLTLAVDGLRLAPGVYTLAVWSDDDRARSRFTVVRP